MMRASKIGCMNANALRRYGMRCLLVAVLAVSVSMAALAAQPSSKAASAESFDVPIKTTSIVKLHHIDDGEPQDAKKLYRNTLSCYYFPDLMVKQDCEEDNIGCEWLAIQRFRGKRPACGMSQVPGERRIPYTGYYRGVKGALVFFDGGECQQGSCPFAVYDSITGKKRFEDEESYDPEEKTPKDRMRVLSTKAGVVIRYLRVSHADCDLHSEGKPCWEKVKAKFQLKSGTIPHCEWYSPEDIAHLTGNPNDSVPSMISYPVEVTLSAHPVSKTLSGPVRCWPEH